MELGRLKQRLRTAQRGHKLLKDKRDEMMRRLLEQVRRARTLRQETARMLAAVRAAQSEAAAALSPAFLAALPTLLALAEAEKTVHCMARELEAARRRVNALEYVLIPELQEQIRRISMKLEENERGNLVRLMKVKELVLAEARTQRFGGQ